MRRLRPIVIGLLLAASLPTTTGVEVAVHVNPFAWWRLDGTFSTFHLTPQLPSTSGDAAAAAFDGNAPGAQWHARSGFLLGPRVRLDALLCHSGALQALGVGAYTRADVLLEGPLTRRLILSVSGQNLLDPIHAEYAGTGAIVTPTQMPRSVRLQLAWPF